MTPPSLFFPIIMILLGGFIFLIALGAFTSSASAGFITLIFATIIIGLGVLWLKSKKTLYHICIASSSGEANALSSFNRQYIEQVVQSINKAIVQYR